jgi:hypothetical protein
MMALTDKNFKLPKSEKRMLAALAARHSPEHLASIRKLFIEAHVSFQNAKLKAHREARDAK